MRRHLVPLLTIGWRATLIAGVLAAGVLLWVQEASGPGPAVSERKTEARVTRADTIVPGASGRGWVRTPLKTLGIEFTGSDGRPHFALVKEEITDHEVGDTVRIRYDSINPTQVKLVRDCKSSAYACGPWAIILPWIGAVFVLCILVGLLVCLYEVWYWWGF